MVSRNLERVLGATAPSRGSWTTGTPLLSGYARYGRGCPAGRTSPAEVEQRTVVQGFEHLEVEWRQEKRDHGASHIGSWSTAVRGWPPRACR